MPMSVVIGNHHPDTSFVFAVHVTYLFCIIYEERARRYLAKQVTRFTTESVVSWCNNGTYLLPVFQFFY